MALDQYPDLGDAMSRYSDEFGTWWAEFPGSDRATWAIPSPHLPDGFVPGPEKTGGAVSRRAPKHRPTFFPVEGHITVMSTLIYAMQLRGCRVWQ